MKHRNDQRSNRNELYRSINREVMALDGLMTTYESFSLLSESSMKLFGRRLSRSQVEAYYLEARIRFYGC